MRYIRTKNGIYDLYKGIWREFTGRKIKTPYCEEYEKQPKLCKSADTIEELCDELVFDNVYHSRMTPSAMHTKENQEVIKSYLKQNIVCYGAIWTSKGLIYVAKMNDEGELELL